jgi:hypothetical protein
MGVAAITGATLVAATGIAVAGPASAPPAQAATTSYCSSYGLQDWTNYLVYTCYGTTKYTNMHVTYRCDSILGNGAWVGLTTRIGLGISGRITLCGPGLFAALGSRSFSG